MKQISISRRGISLLLTLLLLLSVMLPAFPAKAYYFRENGVDVSVYQGTIDWSAFAANNDLRFVIMRAGKLPSPSEAYFVDDNFERNYQGARSVGLKVGCYCRIAANSRDQLLQTTQLYLRTIAGKEFDMPVYLDMEDNSLTRIGNKTVLTNAIIEAMDMIAAAGFHPGLYANLNWYNNNVNGNTVRARGYDLWLARWTHDPDAQDFSNEYSVWQYSDKGSYSGMTGTAVDLDVSYYDYRYAGDHGRTVDTSLSLGQYMTPLKSAPVYYADGISPTGMSVTPSTYCYVQEGYTNGWCRVLYYSQTGQRVGYLPLSVFLETQEPSTQPPTEPETLPIPTFLPPTEVTEETPTEEPLVISEPDLEQDTSYDGILPVQAKVCSDTYYEVYEPDCQTWTGDMIEPEDICTVDMAFTNGWCRVMYPTDHGVYKLGYLELSSFFVKPRSVFGQLYTSDVMQLYNRSLQNPSGKIPAKNLVIYTGETDSMIQIIYASGGQRHVAWLSKREWYEILVSLMNSFIHNKQPLVERQISLVDCDHDNTVDVFDLALLKWRLDHVID